MPQRTGKAAGVAVKSSLRSFELLEYCDSVRRAVTVSELSSCLGYPQSSTSALVQSLLNGGYLVLGTDGRSLTPSGRVSALGRWIEPGTSRAELRQLMEAVGAETGHTVLLGVPSDLCVRYVEVVQGRHPMRLAIPVGARLPLVESGMGALLLSQMPDPLIADLLMRTRQCVQAEGAGGLKTTDLPDIWNADPVVPGLSDLMGSIGETRRQGYSLSLGRVTFGAGIVCVAIATQAGDQPMGLGVGGLSALIERDQGRIRAVIAKEAEKLAIALVPPATGIAGAG